LIPTKRSPPQPVAATSPFCPPELGARGVPDARVGDVILVLGGPELVLVVVARDRQERDPVVRELLVELVPELDPLGLRGRQVDEVPGDEDDRHRVGQECARASRLGDRVEDVLEAILLDGLVHLHVADLREGEERRLRRGAGGSQSERDRDACHERSRTGAGMVGPRICHAPLRVCTSAAQDLRAMLERAARRGK